MDFNPPSGADFAAMDARAARLSVQDCMVLIGYLADRVTFLEDFLVTKLDALPPELPSGMYGFGCDQRRQQAAQLALHKTIR